MQSIIAPDLQTMVILFLKQDAGFEKTPDVNVLLDKNGYQVIYKGAATNISAFGNNAANAYQEFVDKWEMNKHER